MMENSPTYLSSASTIWPITKLKSLFKERKEKNSALQETNLLSLSYGSIIRKDIETKDGLLPANFSGYNVVQKNDIVFRLTDLQNDKHSLRTGIVMEKGIITSAYTTIVPPSDCEPTYYHFLFRAYDNAKVFYSLGNGVRQSAGFQEIGNLLIPVPPFEVQEEIAAYLNEKISLILASIKNETEQIASLQQYRQTLITQVVTKGLNNCTKLKDTSDKFLGRIPENWGVGRLKYCCSYNDEVLPESTPRDEVIQYVDIGNVSLEHGIETIQPFLFGSAPSRARRVAKVNDVIVSTVRTYLRSVARISTNGLTVSTGFCVIRPKTVDPGYLSYFCRSEAFCQSVSSRSYGISYPAINAPELMNTKICLPPMDEQMKISHYLDETLANVQSLIEMKQKKIELLNEYQEAIIFEYVTGKRKAR
jgi:type I restriction enzyme S subunit